MSNTILVAALVFMALPFALYAIERGIEIKNPEILSTSRFFDLGSPISNFAIYSHMIAGGLTTVSAPLQLLSIVRDRWPVFHRIAGYGVAVFASVTATGGLVYIAIQGTIGGPVMDIGFAIYGALMIVSVIKTVQLARRRAPLHRLWAERLIILAMASLLYRVHYGIWEILTGGVGSTPQFSGPFDMVQVFAFYLPYLAVHTVLWNRRQQVLVKLG